MPIIYMPTSNLPTSNLPTTTSKPSSFGIRPILITVIVRDESSIGRPAEANRLRNYAAPLEKKGDKSTNSLPPIFAARRSEESSLGVA